MEGLTLRKATAADMPRIIEIVAGEPGQEAIGLCESVDAARRIGMGAWGIPPFSREWERATLAEADGQIVGVLIAGAAVESTRVTLSLIWLAIKTLGPIKVWRFRPRMAARSRVQPALPAGAFHVGELDVDSRYRNRGIGGTLLDRAETEAINGGYRRMSLTTTTSNPARHLYERHGFRVVETRTDPVYERYTGIQGRVLMVKDLA